MSGGEGGGIVIGGTDDIIPRYKQNKYIMLTGITLYITIICGTKFHIFHGLLHTSEIFWSIFACEYYERL